jgi:large subunit ribosomal protein L10
MSVSENIENQDSLSSKLSKKREKVSGVVRDKPIPEIKKELVKELSDKIKSSRTVMIASCKGLPGQQFHDIKKKLRGKAEMIVARKSAINRAIDSIDKGAVKNLKNQIDANFVIMFSNLDAFELSGILTENLSQAKARPGDISPEDIEIEPGPTELPPGPAISELGSVGLKISVKDGKLEIMKGAIVVKEGEKINENVAGVLSKLNILPMKVGFTPLAAYDSVDDKVYVDIKIDREGTLETLREMLGKSLGFAVNLGYPTTETIGFIIGKAAAQERALSKVIDGGEDESKDVNSEDEGEVKSTSGDGVYEKQSEENEVEDKGEKEDKQIKEKKGEEKSEDNAQENTKEDA